jgi:hypothetical protein
VIDAGNVAYSRFGQFDKVGGNLGARPVPVLLVVGRDRRRLFLDRTAWSGAVDLQ